MQTVDMNSMPETLAIVAHGLRSPIGAIRNAVRMMESAGELPGSMDQARRLIARQAGMLSVLVDDLLQLRTLSQGGIELHREWIDVVAVVNAAVETCAWAVKSAGHTLRMNVPAAPLYAYVDGDRLRQAVTNLLDNACKYTRPFGRIRVSLEAIGAFIVLGVEDNGMGIAGDVLPRVFDLFDRSSRAPARGSGIGLAVVREIATKHDGDVQAKSEGPGLGSTFIIRLPALQPAARLSAVVGAVADNTSPSSSLPDVVPGGLAAWQLKRVLDYIQGNLARSLGVREIAAVAEQSESRFHRAFKRSFGVSVHLYVMCRRIEMAQQLMVSTPEPLSTIAVTCGMCDQSHLTRWFTRLVGEPPNRWRRGRQGAALSGSADCATAGAQRTGTVTRRRMSLPDRRLAVPTGVRDELR